MAENKPVVESIKIGTLDKQIEILEQLGLTKSEILEQTAAITNLIYDTQGQITAENTDTLDIIIQQFAKILEQDELKTIEELARTLLANQSEASVKYVLQHDLIGKVIKHILESDNADFDDKTIDEILSDKALASIVLNNDHLYGTYQKSTVFSKTIISNPVALDELTSTKEKVLKEFRHDTPLRVQFCENKIALSKISEKYGHVYYIDYNLDDRTNSYDYTTDLVGTGQNRFVVLAHGLLDKSGSRDMIATPYRRYSYTHPEEPIDGLDSNHLKKIQNESRGLINSWDGTFIITIPTLNPVEYGEGYYDKPKNAKYNDFQQLYQIHY